MFDVNFVDIEFSLTLFIRRHLELLVLAIFACFATLLRILLPRPSFSEFLEHVQTRTHPQPFLMQLVYRRTQVHSCRLQFLRGIYRVQ